MTIKELREQMARIATNARSKYDEIKDDTAPDRAAEIEREFDAMMADHDKLDQRASRAEKLDAAERAARAGDPRRPRGADGEQPGQDDGKPVTYRDAFHAYLRNRGDASGLSAEERDSLRAGPGGIEQRAQTSSTTTQGGFTVPTELANIIITSMLAHGPMYDPGITTEMITESGGPLTFTTVDDTASVVVKHVQGTTMTDDGGSDVVFGQKQLDAWPFNTEWIRVSKELVDDSAFFVETYLGGLLGTRLGRRANSELTIGDGTGDPNGIVTASALGKTAAAIGAITWDEIMDLEHSVDPAYRVGPKVRYMLNDATLSAIRKLKGGDGQYIWQQGNVQGGVPPMLNGRQFSINQAMASLGTGNKVMLFGDFSEYYVRKVGQPMIFVSSDKDFMPGFGIAGYIRFDGELMNTAAVKHLINA